MSGENTIIQKGFTCVYSDNLLKKQMIILILLYSGTSL